MVRKGRVKKSGIEMWFETKIEREIERKEKMFLE
jgi:hypothetical protein